MADEVLRMTASVRDDFTATLNKLRGQLKSLSSDPAPAKIRKDWAALSEEVGTAAHKMSSSFLPAMRAGNVLGISMGAALAGVGVGLQNFSSRISKISGIASDLGTPAKNIEKLSNEMKILLGVDDNRLERGLQNLHDAMGKIRFDPQAKERLIREFGDAGRQIGIMMTAPIPPKFSEVFKKVGDLIEEMEPSRGRAFARAVFGDDIFQAYFTREVEPKLQAAMDRIKVITERGGREAAEKYQASMQIFEANTQHFRNAVFGPMLEMANRLYEKYDQPFGKGVEKFIENLERGTSRAISAIALLLEKLEKIDAATSLDVIGKAAAAVTQLPQIRQGDFINSMNDWIKTNLPLVDKLSEMLRTKTGGTEAAAAPVPPASVGGASVSVPLPRPPGISTDLNRGLLKVLDDNEKATEKQTRSADEQTKAVEASARKTEEQTQATESANRTSGETNRVMEKLKTGLDRLREKWDDFVNKLSPDAVVGIGATGGPVSVGAGGGIPGGFGGLGWRSSAGGAAAGVGGIGPAGRESAGMPFGPSGGGSISGKNAPGKWWTPERTSFAVNYLKERGGLPEVGARALVARWAGVEAAGGPGSVNPRSGAIGIAQWLGARKSGTPADFEGQLAKAVGELKGGEGRAYRMLKNANTPLEAAMGASQFERAEGYNRSTGADNWVGKTVQTMNSIWGGSNGPIAPGPGPVTDDTANLHRAGVRATPEERAANLPGLQSAIALTQGAGLHVTSGLRVPRGTSLHGHARALDVRARTPEEVDARMAMLREVYGKAGLKEGEHFNFLDEVRNPSKNASAKHLHVSFSQSGINRLKGVDDDGTSSAKPGALLDKASETGVNGGSPSAKLDARGSVNITLSDSLKDKNVKTDTSGMFKDVQVGRGRPARPPENGPVDPHSAIGRASAGF